MPPPPQIPASKKRPNGQDSSTTARQREPRPSRSVSGLPWHGFWRTLVSLLIVVHLTAVFSAPWDLATGDALPPGYVPPAGQSELPPPGSTVWQEPLLPRTLRRFFSPYLNLLYLNHGYEFFAPDPSGTHVIGYRVARPDGSTVEGRFPDLKEQWPRLLYHRYMMLAEQTELMGRESGQHYADYLATRYGGPSRMDWVIHLLLTPQQVLEGTPLDTQSTYKVLATVNGQPRPNEAGPATEGAVAIPGGGR
jgi:hypothetical protein